MFEGVNRLQFNKLLEITHVQSKDGEVVELVKPSPTGMNVDSWLSQFDAHMNETVKHAFFHAFQSQDLSSMEDWVQQWPGQAVYLTSHVWFNLRIQAIF